MNPREAARARQLTAAGLNPQQVRAALEGRRRAIADSWRNKPDPHAVSRWMGHAVTDPEVWS